MSSAQTLTAQERELAQLIVEALNLEITADDIDPTAPLYREGLGLDSIDILEIALTISKKYGFQLQSDDADNVPDLQLAAQPQRACPGTAHAVSTARGIAAATGSPDVAR